MKPGDLVIVELPESLAEIPTYRAWNGCLALVLSEYLPTVRRSWNILVNGEMKCLNEIYLRRIDETW
jgi:hypothetical protein